MHGRGPGRWLRRLDDKVLVFLAILIAAIVWGLFALVVGTTGN